MEKIPGGAGDLQQPKLNFEELPYLECENELCKGTQFTEITMFKKVSRILTGSPTDQVVPVPTFICAKCGHLNKIFTPKG
jgi:hypothetical protein